MSARTKLNGIAIASVLAFAALVGGASNSWLVFIAVTAICIALLIYTGVMRVTPNDASPRRRGPRSSGR